MVNPEPLEEEFAGTDRAVAELEQELTRVGVDWHAFSDALRAQDPEAFAQAEREGETAFGIDARSALAIARTLETGAGTGAFLAALGISGPPST
jgi:hypothetical protein